MNMNKKVSLALLTAAMGFTAEQAMASCQFANGIQHVVYIQFDNVHYERDNQNVPSDLEQMPNLYNFLKGQGTFLANHHTPLISHTADDILTSLTGIYGDKHGQPISNSYGYFKANGSIGFSSSFAYWTDPSAESNPVPIMYGKNGLVAPAPWVPFTRMGCDVGQVSVANTILENVGSDITTVFGAGSPEALEASSNNAQAVADFEGIGIHCAINSALCKNSNAKTDKLRNELGGYAGYKALFGHKYVQAAINAGNPLVDLDGNVITDGNGHNGFPGFGGISASQSLGYVAKMLESGVPIVYAYISDAHDNHATGGTAYGPGEAGYVAALKADDAAFGKFFTRLNNDGINASNTLFVVLTDEQDHYAGTQNPTPAGCDGVTTPCVYNHTANSAATRNVANVGEVNVNLSALLATEKNNTTPFSVHSDSAPTFYLTGNPAQTSATTRQLERDVANLTTYNPYKALTEATADYVVDQAGMGMIHMVTGDSQRTPTFVAFLKGDYYAFASGTTPCKETNFTDCVNIQSGFAYNHGSYQPEITTTWMGIVGPGVKASGIDTTTWSDHTDIRPTMLNLLGLVDSYQHDGRVLAEILNDSAVPASIGPSGSSSRNAFVSLAQAYKQINASVGALGLKTLQASTVALTGNDAGDLTYATCEAKISSWVQTRNTLAQQMISILEAAVFNGTPVDPTTAISLISQANSLIANASC